MSLSSTDLLRLTFHALRGNPVRSTLSMVGVFMGVAAVSATLQVGSISRAVIQQELQKRDAPSIAIYPRWEPGKTYRRFTTDDLTFLQQRLGRSDSVSAVSYAGASSMLFQDQESNPFVLAVTQNFLGSTGRRLLSGRLFTQADFNNYRSVLVMDSFLADSLFGQVNVDPVGQRVYVDQRPYVVIGVVEAKIDEEDEAPQGEAYLPMSLHHALQGDRDLGNMLIHAQNLDTIEPLEEQAKALLTQRSPEQKYWTWNNVEDIREQQRVLTLASRSLAAVGMVTLLVGGVGIANIMIASVTERTAEIGLRRAIGATQRDVMLQFILESVVISVVGGAIAIATVHGLTRIIATTFNLPYQFEQRTALISLGSALLVGVGASFAPALQASRLDPVEALRSD